MSLITKEDAMKLIKNQRLVDDIIQEVLVNKDMMQSLAKEVAKQVAEVLDKDEKFRERMLKAASKDLAFKKQLMDKIINELN
ncbi:MAG: hypothetical protein Q8M83_00800 [bacterium]|nr:hypothetical protein [bacterium]